MFRRDSVIHVFGATSGDAGLAGLNTLPKLERITLCKTELTEAGVTEVQTL